MRRRALQTVGALAVLVLLAPAAVVADRPQPTPADRTISFFLGLVPYAKTVGVATVSDARVEPIEDVLKSEPGKTAWREVATFDWQTMLYGAKDKADGNTVSLAAMPPRAPQKPNPALKKGDRLLVLQIRQPDRKWTFDAAVAWSKETENAALEALAPGWARADGRSFLCPWCVGRDVTDDIGKCATCGHRTSSGMLKLCPTCAALSGHCQICARTVGPATPQVTLRLGTTDPVAKVKDPFLINIAPGTWPALYVSVTGTAEPVPELLCGNNDLSDSTTLFFIVDGSQPAGRTAAFPKRPERDRTFQLKPLVCPAIAQIELSGPVNPFAKNGTYTVRAVSARLVSKPVTVVVKELGTGGGPPPGAPPPGVSIDADGNALSRLQDGRIMWKMALGFHIGQVTENDGKLVITSADGTTQVVVDAATGKMIEKRAIR